MSIVSSTTFRRLVLALVVAGLCVSVSACGVSRRKKIYDITQSEITAGGEPYFFAGKMTYQIQVSRQLNPYSTEDVQYLAGIAGAQHIPASDMWFGVFLWAKNQSGTYVSTTDRITLHDSAGDVYYPVKLNPSVNAFAWTAQTLAPDGTEPAEDTTASNGPTQGGLVLFEVSQSVYSNRPLTLYVYPPHGKPSLASLDL